MPHRITTRGLLAAMLIGSFGIGAIIIVEGLYRYSLGGWPLYEGGSLSHGVYRRFSGVFTLVHAAFFFLVALRLRRPRPSILLLYPVSLVTLLGASLIALDVAWKGAAGFRPALGS